MAAVSRSARADALQRLSRLKSRIVVATLLGFGALSGLAAAHQTGVTAAVTPATPPAATTPPSASESGGGFFDQGGSGYGFGSGSSAQPPVAASGVS